MSTKKYIAGKDIEIESFYSYLKSKGLKVEFATQPHAVIVAGIVRLTQKTMRGCLISEGGDGFYSKVDGQNFLRLKHDNNFVSFTPHVEGESVLLQVSFENGTKEEYIREYMYSEVKKKVKTKWPQLFEK